MVAAVKSSRSTSSLPDNALARKAIETIQQIEREAQEKKIAQLESLQSAKAAIVARVKELTHQLEQIDVAAASITGKPLSKERRVRRDLTEDRQRVARWLEGRRGQKFAAGDLVREFPELDGTPMSIFLKPLVEEGKIQTDTSAGMRRTKYYVAD